MSLLIDVLNTMKQNKVGVDFMGIVIQSYMTEFGFLSEEDAKQVRLILVEAGSCDIERFM